MKMEQYTSRLTTTTIAVVVMGLTGLIVLSPSGCSGDSHTYAPGRTSSSGAGTTGGGGGAMLVCVPGAIESCYNGAAKTEGVGSCKAGTKTCLEDGSGYVPCAGEVLPQLEVCNGADEDCDGIADDGALITYHPDIDEDGYGEPMTSVEACSAPAGFVADGTDCDDANPDVNPSAAEIANGEDDDCNGQLNDGVYFQSCQAILMSLPGSASGPYTIDPDGPMGSGVPFEVSCDMTSDGGGWTLIAKTTGEISGAIQAWVDVLSQNFFFTAGNFTTSQGVPSGYLNGVDFFAILHTAAELPFSEIRLDDNKSISLQSTASPRTLRMIHDANGVEPLYRNGANTGVLVLLGNANHTGMFPCYYPTLDALSCASYFAGDIGSESTAFYVGDLDMCAAGPAPGDPVAALWGSFDCYAIDESGGHGGFTFRRPFHINNGEGGRVSRGFASGGWSIHVR